MAANKLIKYHDDGRLVIGDWIGTVTFPSTVLFQDGSEGIPSISFADDTNTGFYRIANEAIGVAVAGETFVKIQGGPNRFLIGSDADNIVAETTFHVEDVDAGIKLNRTVAAEAFIATIVQGTGGGMQRGLVAGGLRWTHGATITDEFMRLTADKELLIGTTVPFAHLTMFQPGTSVSHLYRFRNDSGINSQLDEDGFLTINQTDTGITSPRGVLTLGGGNAGAANTTAAIGFPVGTGNTYANFISSHNSGSVGLNGYRFWTNNAVSDADFATAGDRNITFSMFNQRAAVGIELPDAVFSVTGSVDPLADLNDPTDYHLYLHNKQDNNGEGAGICFSVDASDGFVGAAIIHERVNNGSYGSLNFYTQQTIATNPDPTLVLKLDEENKATFSPGTKCDGYIIKPAAEVQTTDATVTTADSLTLLDENTYLVRAFVVGVKSDGSDRAVYHIEGAFYRTGAGNATLQGAVISLLTQESDANWACTMDTNSNDVRVRVTGFAATTIEWSCVIQYLNMSN